MTLRLVSLSSTPSTRTPAIVPSSRRSSSLGTCSPLRSGRVNQNLEPLPTVLSAPIWPPMASTRPLAMERPRPVPPCRRVVEASAWTNGLNSCSSTGAGMPMPLSRTAKRMTAPAVVLRLEDHVDVHLALVGELDGVAHQVGEYLAQTAGVAAQGRGHVGLHQDRQLDALLVGLDGQQGHHVLEGQPRSKSMFSNSIFLASTLEKSRMSPMTVSSASALDWMVSA